MAREVALEIAVQDTDGVRIATEVGASRVELCSALGATGGLTPSVGLLEAAVAVAAEAAGGGVPVEVHPLVRPRPGGFVFSAAELDVQVRDVRAAVAAGAAGVVIGALTSDGLVDEAAVRALVAAAGGREVPSTGRSTSSRTSPRPSTSSRDWGSRACSRRVVRLAASTGSTGWVPWLGTPQGACRSRRVGECEPRTWETSWRRAWTRSTSRPRASGPTTAAPAAGAGPATRSRTWERHVRPALRSTWRWAPEQGARRILTP